MLTLVLAALFCLTIPAAMADESNIHRIASDGTYRPPGYPAAIPRLLAIGGKPMVFKWTSTSKGSTTHFQVDRVTASRRIPVSKGKVLLTDKAWTWEWTPPVTRSTVTYEFRLDANSEPIASVEVRDPKWLNAQRSELAKLAWESAGLDPREAAALATIGLRKITRETSTSGVPIPLLTSNNNSSRRQVTWDAEHHDLIVMRPGIAAGDLDIRAPRWWISPEALATDQGLIRFLDLFGEVPINP
jgi:hypothetical protein